MIPSQSPNNNDNFFAESSLDLENGLMAKEVSLTNEQIDRIFDERFGGAANEDAFNPRNRNGATLIMARAQNFTEAMTTGVQRIAA